MTPVMQTKFGKDGNCWPACLASLFDVPIEEVDQCACQNSDWRERTEQWLAARGLFYVEVPWPGTGPLPITAPPDGTLMIAGCWSNRKLPHVIIVRVRTEILDGSKIQLSLELVHDPHPGDPEIITRVDGLMFFGALHK